MLSLNFVLQFRAPCTRATIDFSHLFDAFATQAVRMARNFEIEDALRRAI